MPPRCSQQKVLRHKTQRFMPEILIRARSLCEPQVSSYEGGKSNTSQDGSVGRKMRFCLYSESTTPLMNAHSSSLPMESDQLNLKLPLPTAYCHNRVLLNLLLHLRVSPPKHLTCSMQRLSLLCVKRAHGQLMRAPPARRRPWCNSSAARKEGQRSLVCCSPWGCKELDTSYRWNDNSSLCRECFNSARPCASLLSQLQVNHTRTSSLAVPRRSTNIPGFEPSAARIFSTLSCLESGSCINLRLDAEALQKACALTPNGYRVSSEGDGTVLELDRADAARHSEYAKTSAQFCPLKQ